MWRAIGSVALACLVGVASAAAQPERPERPYRGLFGGGVGNSEQLLTLNISFGGGYDDNILADAGGPASVGEGDPRSARSGGYGQLFGGMSYALNRRRVNFAASAESTVRYYSDPLVDFTGAHSGSAGMSVQVAKNTTLRVDGSATYQPYFLLLPIPQLFDPELGEAQDPGLDYAPRRLESVRYMTGGSLTQTIGARTSLSLFTNYAKSDPSGRFLDFMSRSGGLRVSRGLSRHASLRLGYEYQDANYGEVVDRRQVQAHNIDTGVDYRRALSSSRRTTVAFGTGSVVIVDRGRRHFNLIGSGSINREIGRTWDLGVSYVRGVGVFETFADPVQSDALTVGLSGLVNRRVQFTSAASYSKGAIGLVTSDNGFDTYSGTVGLHYGFSRYVGVLGEYFYYHYSFENSAALPTSLPRELDRQGVRALLTTWIPLVHRARRPDAAR